METRFYKVISYVEVFVPNSTSAEESERQAEAKVRDQDDMFEDNIVLEQDEADDPFELMSDEFRLAVDIFEQYDLDECIAWFEKARFNGGVYDDG